MGTGATGSTLAPSSLAGGVYFTLQSAGWGGTPADGDTLEFTTFPQGSGIWYKRNIPAGSSAHSNDTVAVCIEGESA
jgi:hypothetical protein